MYTADHAPASLPRDASMYFSKHLLPYVSALAKADNQKKRPCGDLPLEIENAIEFSNGEFPEKYKYLKDFVDKYGDGPEPEEPPETI
jgi:hypothetical protein